jgi:hypothetical protein
MTAHSSPSRVSVRLTLLPGSRFRKRFLEGPFVKIVFQKGQNKKLTPIFFHGPSGYATGSRRL